MAKMASYSDRKLDQFIEEYNPDEYDRRIIRILSHDGRASYTEIAEIIGVTPATVRNRVKRLQEYKIIKNFKPLIDKRLYNLEISSLFFISLESSKLTDSVVTKLQEFSEITKIDIMANDPNIIATIYAQSMSQFSMILSEITQMDEVKEVQSNFILKSVTSGYLV